MRRTRYGVDYDEIAREYDRQPFRTKEVDPDFLSLLTRGDPARLAVLDVGCGTGNQLVANAAHDARPRFVGLDPFAAMLAEARKKSAAIAWVRGEGQRLPFAGASFDLVTSQFSFHHVEEKEAMLAEVVRVLKQGGTFVMRNVHPHASRASTLYRFFPRALETDLVAFPSEERYRGLFAALVDVTVDVERRAFSRSLSSVAERFRRKSDCSHLHVLADEEWRAGLAAIDVEIAKRGSEAEIADEIALVRIAGAKR